MMTKEKMDRAREKARWLRERQAEGDYTNPYNEYCLLADLVDKVDKLEEAANLTLNILSEWEHEGPLEPYLDPDQVAIAVAMLILALRK